MNLANHLDLLLKGKIRLEDLSETDEIANARQKGVDLRIGLDIASLSYRRAVRPLPRAQLRHPRVSGAFAEIRDELREMSVDVVVSTWRAPLTKQLSCGSM